MPQRRFALSEYLHVLKLAFENSSYPLSSYTIDDLEALRRENMTQYMLYSALDALASFVAAPEHSVALSLILSRGGPQIHVTSDPYFRRNVSSIDKDLTTLWNDLRIIASARSGTGLPPLEDDPAILQLAMDVSRIHFEKIQKRYHKHLCEYLKFIDYARSLELAVSHSETLLLVQNVLDTTREAIHDTANSWVSMGYLIIFLWSIAPQLSEIVEESQWVRLLEASYDYQLARGMQSIRSFNN